MTYSIPQLIDIFTKSEGVGENCAKLIPLLEREKERGVKAMSLGTWAPGHPKNIEELAEGLISMFHAMTEINSLPKNIKDQMSNDFLKIDSLECEKQRLLQLIGRIKRNFPNTGEYIDDYIEDTYISKKKQKEVDMFNLGYKHNW